MGGLDPAIYVFRRYTSLASGDRNGGALEKAAAMENHASTARHSYAIAGTTRLTSVRSSES
jgi:hypothetical protein